MKNMVVKKEGKKGINKKKMRMVLENICRYFNKDITLIEKYNNKK